MTATQSGHRSRLLDRYAKSGLRGMHDYEIIELILTFVIPRKDTKPVAKQLIAHYKSVNGICNADLKDLQRFRGIGRKSALFLSLFKEVTTHCLSEKCVRGSVISRRSDVENHLRFHIGTRKDEYVVALFLDNSNHILSTDELNTGTVNQCVVYPRVIVEKALKHGASAVILAHNHPGGCTNPSDSDWQVTEKLYLAARVFDITLLDHIIVLPDMVVSLKDHARWPK